jgi:hypothetical protein
MKTAARSAVLLATAVLLAACGRAERVREIDWAKAALARNPAFEILSTDESTGAFTVRDTSTGAVRTLRLEELVAAPLTPRTTAKPAAAEPAPAATPAETPESLVENAAATPEDPVVVRAVPAGTGTPVSEGPGYRITRGEDKPVTASNLEGPGYSISRDEPTTGKSGQGAEAVAANVERRTDPIICQGDRLMRIDGETIEFTGDAVIAEKGCDLYISNSRIRSGGVGIIARQARVHIVNSTIGGTLASYEASDGAEIYVASSTFAGVGRRFDSATMNDLGGNQYKLTH